MSKDFEQAYKELAQNETPDLWDRIEAGLKEKSAPEQKREEKKHTQVSFGSYAKVAAAVICAAIIIPAFYNISRPEGNSFSGMADGGGMEAAYDTAAAESASEEICETVEEEMAEGGEGTATADRSDEQATAGIYEEKRENTGSGSLETAKTESAAEENDKVQASMQDKEPAEELTDGMVLTVTVEVTEETMNYGEDNDLPLGSLFTALVREDASGLLEEGEQIEIFVPVYSSQMLAAGNVFQVEIIYESDGEYPFRLQLCHGMLEQ